MVSGIKTLLIAAGGALGGLLLVQSPTSAAMLEVAAHTADASPRSSGDIIDTTNAVFYVGHGSDNKVNSPVFVFQLPTLPPGETVESATFDARFSLDQGALSVDLWALAVRADSTVLTTDFGQGESPAGPTGQRKIADNFVTGANSLGRYQTDATQSLELGDFIADNYVAGQYLFLRLTPVNPLLNSANDRLRFNTADDADAGDKPILSLTTVPEPGALALAVLAVPVLWRRRAV